MSIDRSPVDLRTAVLEPDGDGEVAAAMHGGDLLDRLADRAEASGDPAERARQRLGPLLDRAPCAEQRDVVVR